MNKGVKIISTLLIAVMLVITMSQVALANDNDNDTYTNLISSIDSNATGISNEIDGVANVATKVVKLIRNVAAIAAVVIISILGIKYMMGSTEERADYKKSFIPLIVGVVVVLAAASIASLIFSVGTTA